MKRWGGRESACVVLRWGATYLVYLLLFLLNIFPLGLKSRRIVECGLCVVPQVEEALLQSKVVPYQGQHFPGSVQEKQAYWLLSRWHFRALLGLGRGT